MNLITWFKTWKLTRKNKKLKRQAYWKEFNEVIDQVGDIAEAESIMWCREHGFTDDGSDFVDKRLCKEDLKLVVGG